jgi:hypothetical protein
MPVFYMRHKVGRGGVLFEEAATPQLALERALAGRRNDGQWEVWPTVIQKINNENY